MTISTFLKLMRKYIGTDKKSILEFCGFIFALVMTPPTEREEVLDETDAYYPFTKSSEKSSANKMYNGERPIPADIALRVHSHFDKTDFLDVIGNLSYDVELTLCEDLNKLSVDCNDTNVDEVCAELFHSLIKAAVKSEEKIEINPFEKRDEVGRVIPAVPITPTRYFNGTVYIGNETITLPIQLIPKDSIETTELPYINALCEVYSEKLNAIIDTTTLDTMPGSYKRHLREQRKAYYSAESIQRSVREVFADGEIQFNALKQDAYDGIEMVYYDDTHSSGYDRLQAVLEKITNTTLSRSALMNIVGLINNLEKKGVCHILVNDDTIKSWVNIDE